MLDCMCAGGMHLAALMAGTWSASMAPPGSLYGARAWRTAPILAWRSQATCRFVLWEMPMLSYPLRLYLRCHLH